MYKTPARLDVSYNSNSFKQFFLQESNIGIGRSPDNELILSETHISRHHCQIIWQNDAYILFDLGSKAGTFVNEQRLSENHPHILRDKDQISIANFKIQYFEKAFAPTKMSVNGKTLLQETEIPIELDLIGHTNLKIGRDLGNEFVISHPLVSRFHTQIELKDGAFYIRDLSSTNGTFVNGNRIKKEYRLRVGDNIRIGSCHLILNIDNKLTGTDEEGNLRLDAIAINKVVGPQKIKLLNEISLSILAREFVTVAGVSGGGKSTLLDALNGLRPATSGEVLVNGFDLYKNFNAYRNEIGYVPQQDIIHKTLTVRQSLSYAAKLRMPIDTSSQEYQTRIQEVLDDLELTPCQDTVVANLSGGQLKRVSMGVELLTKPSLFFLDEATSGLDPGTEVEIMSLLRRLADQGRTILLITHNTENVTLCDLVVFLAAGGRIAYFGPPNGAPEYFGVQAFNQIYRKVECERSPDEWQRLYLNSAYYQTYVLQRQGYLKQSSNHHQISHRKQPQAVSQGQKIAFWKQLRVLTLRNIDILKQDKNSLFFMMVIAPILGILDFFIWPRNLFDVKNGDPQQTLMMLFVAVIISIMVGSLASMREIVKENDIYRRERMVFLQLWPYLLSKLLTGILVCFYQAAIFTFFKFLVIIFPHGASDILGIYITLLLATIGGMVMGLLVSAFAPNQNVAPLLIILILIPQITLGGGMLPIQTLPLPGQILSHATFSRWAFESMVTITGIGQDIATDQCFNLSQDKLSQLTEAQKVTQCTCLGPQLFTKCKFPGIKGKFNAAVKEIEPAKPIDPGPVPDTSYALAEYQSQVEQYKKDVNTWQDQYSKWKENRESAIGEGEGIINEFYKNYGKVFAVNLVKTWGLLGGLSVILFLCILPIQKRKSMV